MFSLLKRALANPGLRALLLLAIFAGVAQACPNCGSAVGDNDQATGGSIGSGYQYSIYFMMAVPYAILFSAGFWVYRSFSRALAEHESAHQAKVGLVASEMDSALIA